ncbi:ATPase family AAA domain-containing protein 5b isoform X2 [Micropterus salmoides]|uniref:ATPase family AAA domain-containing protein 5b isoform X2 n=1 Tax=Micropterus salmoides TaxID=27706 RepID=UPI0018ED971C|nr:ATPase family AAA domain-containing protein 5b isoform X2 [Micropterus salmoides]
MHDSPAPKPKCHREVFKSSRYLKPFMMRNKLKRSKTCKDVSRPSKDRQRAAEVIPLVLTESSCSSHETSDSTFCAKYIKIAPIFVHTARHSKSKRTSDRKQDQHVNKLQESAPQSEDVQLVKSEQRLSVSVFHLTEKNGPSWRGQLSPSALHCCLDEIQTSNPAFPARTVFSTFQKKASERLQNSLSTGNSPHQRSLQNHIKEKRKRGNESTERVPKRPKCGLVGMGYCHMSVQVVQESTVLTAKEQPRRNKLSRTHRLRQQSGSPAGLVNNCEPGSGLINCTESYFQSLKPSDILQRDYSFEDIPWTDKYSPQHSSEVVGNSASVNKLQCWLKKWKLRAECDERRKMEERKQEDNSIDSWDCGDFQGEAGAEDDTEEPLCNAMLITGPPGVGKTASVYACCQELGFKVFEVNCSSQRSGRQVLSQLKEATQSHLVEMSGKDPLKPTYFNNYSCTPKSETLPGKAVPSRNVTSNPKKRAAQTFGQSSRKGKANPATVTLANYFKMKAKADHLHFSGLSPSEKPDSKKSGNPSPGCDQTVPQNKKTATSLILFEEVDVIFDDDVGFLAAIKTFMTTTKRPVILTTNDPSFRERFSCGIEEIIFKTPSVENVCSYLQLVGLAENVRLELDDVSSLIRLFRGDVRRCLLQLQLWVQSGRGRASQSGGSPKEPTHVQRSNVTERGDNADFQHPQYDTGCTASMLGHPPVSQNQLRNLLKCGYWTEIDMLRLLRLLAESWRGGVPLLYSNLELLLPIEAKETSVHIVGRGTCSGLQSELALSDIDLQIQQLDGNVSPKASATNSISVRSNSTLSRGKYDTTSSSSLTQTPPRPSLSSKRAHSRTSSSRDKTEENAAKVTTYCLDALADFFDLMSYLDATMPAAVPLVSGSCRPEAFAWTGAGIKDGLLDEMSEEEGGRSWSQERLAEVQAVVEGLGCHRCCWQVSKAWTEVQKHRQELGDISWGRLVERLSLPASSKRQSFRFSFQPLCAPSVSQRRYELNRTVLGSESFSLLGNRQAVSVDYMPVLRYICRFQREQQQKEEPVRFLKYLSRLHLGLSKSTIQHLAEEFSERSSHPHYLTLP